MITNKIELQNIINQYYLGINESVKWVIKDKTLQIDFITPNKDLIGKVFYKEFNLEDCNLVIFDTKKLNNLLSIFPGDLIILVEKNHIIATKLKISNIHFDVVYTLADPILVGKVATVNTPEWDLTLELSQENIFNLIKAQNALTSDINHFVLKTGVDDLGIDYWDFVFGDPSNHSNKISYKIQGKHNKNFNLEIPFNSQIMRDVLLANKNFDSSKLYLSQKGLLKFEFENDKAKNEYYLVRKQDNLL